MKKLKYLITLYFAFAAQNISTIIILKTSDENSIAIASLLENSFLKEHLDQVIAVKSDTNTVNRFLNCLKTVIELNDSYRKQSHFDYMERLSSEFFKKIESTADIVKVLNLNELFRSKVDKLENSSIKEKLNVEDLSQRTDTPDFERIHQALQHIITHKIISLFKNSPEVLIDCVLESKIPDLVWAILGIKKDLSEEFKDNICIILKLWIIKLLYCDQKEVEEKMIKSNTTS